MSDTSNRESLPAVLTPLQREVLERLLIRYHIKKIPPPPFFQFPFDKIVATTGAVLIIFALLLWSEWDWSKTAFFVIGGIAFATFLGIVIGVEHIAQNYEKALIAPYCPSTWDQEQDIRAKIPKKCDADLLIDESLMRAELFESSQKAKVIVRPASAGFEVFLLTVVVLFLGCCAMNPSREDHLIELKATQGQRREFTSAEDFEFRTVGIASFAFRKSDLPESQAIGIEIIQTKAISVGCLNSVWRINNPKL